MQATPRVAADLSADGTGAFALDVRALVALGRSRRRGAKLHQLLLGHVHGVGRRLHRTKRVGADANLAQSSRRVEVAEADGRGGDHAPVQRVEDALGHLVIVGQEAAQHCTQSEVDGKHPNCEQVTVRRDAKQRSKHCSIGAAPHRVDHLQSHGEERYAAESKQAHEYTPCRRGGMLNIAVSDGGKCHASEVEGVDRADVGLERRERKRGRSKEGS
mmetsp:Transcript_49563/g.119365  ORF Transcript_49563/g.119365 Transcript_49563/m.119365 type:complete len:216 (+) Transcript_49563:97-744(+)